MHLTLHSAKSFSNHSYGYDPSNDLPDCFASYAVNAGSGAIYPGERPAGREHVV